MTGLVGTLVWCTIILVFFHILFRRGMRKQAPLMFSQSAEKLSENEYAEFESKLEEYRSWAAASGFEFDGLYSISTPKLSRAVVWAVWNLSAAPTRVIVSFSSCGESIMFGTGIENDGLVMTASDGVALALPEPPESFLQAFTDKSLDELWNEHIAGESFVIEMLGREPRSKLLAVEPAVELNTRRIREETQSQVLWEYRMLMWGLTHRLKVKHNVNRPIAERYTHLLKPGA